MHTERSVRGLLQGELSVETWWADRSVTGTDVFSGHRKITFEEIDEAEESEPFVFGRGVDLMLLADNRIIASTAGSGRYAAGQPFFARDAHRYAELYQSCSADMTPCAFLHVRSVALISGRWLSDSGFLVAMVIHGNTARTLRVLSHCFAEDIRLPEPGAGSTGLRRDDEPCYRVLCGVRQQFYKLMRGAGREVSITTRPALVAMLDERVHSIWSMLGLPQMALPTEQIPFPCLGTVNVARMSAMLLCLGLWLTRRGEALSRSGAIEVQEDARQLCPCFSVPLLAEEWSGWGKDALPIELAAAVRLASFDRAIFACEMQSEERRLLIRFSPLCPQREELYALRSRPSAENAEVT
jgi:hypothetical protein